MDTMAMKLATLMVLVLPGLVASQLTDQLFSTSSGMRVTLLKLGGGVMLRLNSSTTEQITAKLARIVELDDLGFELGEQRTVDSFVGVVPSVTSGLLTSGQNTYTYLRVAYQLSQFKLPLSCPTSSGALGRRLAQATTKTAATTTTTTESATANATSTADTVDATADPTAAAAPSTVTAGSLTMTFYFGYAFNMSFPYGNGTTITAPGGSLKYSMEVNGWPFCSPYNTLRMELLFTSPVPDPLPSIVQQGSAASDGSMTTDGSGFSAPAAARRRLSEATATSETSGGARVARRLAATANATANATFVLGQMYLDPAAQAKFDAAAGPAVKVNFTTASATAAVTAARKARLPVVIKMLSSSKSAASLSFPDWAYTAVNSSNLANISVALGIASTTAGGTNVTLTFPSFDTLYYDPVVQLNQNADGMSSSAVSLCGTYCGSGSISMQLTGSSASGLRASAAWLVAAVTAVAALL